MHAPILGQRFTTVGETHSYLIGARAEARERILREIVVTARMEEQNCLCGGTRTGEVLLATIDRWGLPAQNVLCANCALIRITPRWDEKTYSNIYERYFWPLQTGMWELTRERFEMSVRRAGPFTDYVRNCVDLEGKDVVEIGCSYGAGLYRLKSTGARLRGYDYDEHFLDIGRTMTGLDLRRGGTREALECGDQYDVVMLRHVFEHFLDPVAECKRLADLLRPHGVLVIEVPGVFQLIEGTDDLLLYFNVFHTYCYTQRTLTNLMNMCGFQCVRGDERVYSVWRKASTGNVSTGNVVWEAPETYSEVLSYLLDVEKKWQTTRRKGRGMIARTKRIMRSAWGITHKRWMK